MTTVAEYVEGAFETAALQRTQVQSAGTIIAQFLRIREGLIGRIGDHKIDAVAATLTAGILAKNKDD